MILREVNRVGEEQKNVPKLRFKGYESAWEQRKLGDITEKFEYGLNASATDFDGENQYLRITDIDDESREFNKTSLTSPDTNLDYADNYLLKQGDILFARTGASVGKTYQYKESDGKVYYAGFLIRARILSEFNPGFVFQNTLTKRYENFISITSQRSGQPGINAQEYASFNLLLPKFEEQEQIADLFIRLDNLITLHQRKYDALKTMKKTLLSKMFPKDGEDVPEIRFKGFTDAWEQRKLKEIGEIQTGNTPPTTDSQNYSEDGMLWVTPTDIEELVITKTAKRISEIGKKKARIASKGSILVTCIASIGKNTLLSEDAAFNQQINSISPNGEYDSYFLLTQSFKISEKMANSAAAATMQIVNKSQFSNLDTILPIFTEQVEIGRLFLYLDNIITLHQRRSSRSIK